MLHTDLARGLAPGFWAEVPTLSWVADLETGRLRFNDPPAVPVDLEVWAASLRPHIKGNGKTPFQVVETLPGRNGRPHHFLIIGFPLGGLIGAAQRWLSGVAIDVTDYKRRVDELAHQALVDELTGLYNLRGFFLFAEHELKVARRRGTRSAILYIDVDGLKQVNDTQGHDKGSAVLVATASLLRHVFRECDVIARLGGDEFAIFAADIQHDPEQLRRRLSRAVAEENADGGPPLSLSSGVGSCPADPGLSLTDLLNAADQAMYNDKAETSASVLEPVSGPENPRDRR